MFRECLQDTLFALSEPPMPIRLYTSSELCAGSRITGVHRCLKCSEASYEAGCCQFAKQARHPHEKPLHCRVPDPTTWLQTRDCFGRVGPDLQTAPKQGSSATRQSIVAAIIASNAKVCTRDCSSKACNHISLFEMISCIRTAASWMR